MLDPFCIHPFKPGIAIPGSGMHPHLESIQRHCRDIHGLQSHGHQGNRHLLACGQQHVHLPLFCFGIHTVCQRDQFICSLPHSGQDYHHIVACLVIFYTASGHVINPFLVSDGRAAKFLYDQHTSSCSKCVINW